MPFTLQIRKWTHGSRADGAWLCPCSLCNDTSIEAESLARCGPNAGPEVARIFRSRHNGDVVFSADELRQHPRFHLALQVMVDGPVGQVTSTTVGLSRNGLSLRLSPQPAVNEALGIVIDLPSGQVVSCQGRCRATIPGAIVGISLEFDEKNREVWDAFVDEEESTGSLWRMIGRIAHSPGDDFAPRRIVEHNDDGQVQFHTVGENGLAYRIAFGRLPSDPYDESDLCARFPGFRELARTVVGRVLREDFTFRIDESNVVKLARARLIELKRGGWAYVQGGGDSPVTLVTLGLGELLLVQEGVKTVFPHFTGLELEQIACDTFRHDLTRPAFARSALPRAVALPPLLAPVPMSARPDLTRFHHGYDAVRFAQAVATDVQVRRYVDREIFFHPSVWAKVKEAGRELMGPTMQDGQQLCVLGLVGAGAPKVVRLSETSEVSVLKRPR